MFGRSAFVFLAVLSLATVGFSVNLLSPTIQGVKNGDVIDLGTIGPGQTVSILIDPVMTTGGIHGSGGVYDRAEAIELPRGWTTSASKLYQNPLQVTITADSKAKEGSYNTSITVIDELGGEQLGDVTFKVKVRITYDVMDFDVTPTSITTGPGQPARFAITISNKASTSDVFELGADGLGRRWDFRKLIFVPAMTSKTMYYEVAGSEEEVYTPTISVVSKASDIIHDEKNITLVVRSDLIGDYKATNHGTLIFPIFEATAYSLAGLLSNLFGS